MARTVTDEQYVKKTPSLNKANTAEVLDGSQMAELLTETNQTLSNFGIDMERTDYMGQVLNDRGTASMYIDALAEGLNEEDTRNFKMLCENMLDVMTGKAQGSQSIMGLLNEGNLSASFLPKAKLVFPMFRFTWRAICY